METNLPVEAAQAKNKLEAGTWFYRVAWVFRDSSTAYFCNNKESFTYGGNIYHMLPFTLSPLTKGTGSELPTRTLSVAGEAVDTFLKPYIRDKGGIRGSTVTITQVYYEQPAIDMSATQEVYKASHYVASDAAIAIHLSYVRLRNQQIPIYQYTSIRCRVVSEFKGTLCGYGGVDATCEGTKEDCASKSNLARFNAELGLKPGTLRLA